MRSDSLTMRMLAFVLVLIASVIMKNPALAAPAIPTNVQASNGTYVNKVRVTWSTVSGASYYRVHRAFHGSAVWTTIDSYVTGTVFEDTNVIHGYSYDYRISACASGDCSAWSWPPDEGYPGLATPTNVQASDGTYDNKTCVTWNAVDGATSYLVRWGEKGDGGCQGYQHEVIVSGYAGWDPSWCDGNVDPGVVYCYYVYARNDLDLSSYATDTGYRRMPIPTNVTVSRGTPCNYIHVGWNSVTGADYYKVERGPATGPDTAFTVDAAWPVLYDSDTYLSMTYYYWVRACSDETGCGYATTAQHGFRGPPQPPGSMSATNGAYADHVQLIWPSVQDATSYTVYRGGTLFSQMPIASGVTGTSYDDYAAHCAMPSYYYSVAACNGCGETGLSDTGWVMACTPTPTASHTVPYTATPTKTPTATGTHTFVATPTRTATSQHTAAPTNTDRPSPTATNTLRPRPTPTNTRRPYYDYRGWLQLLMRSR